MKQPFHKWVKKNEYDVQQLFSIFTTHFPECKEVYRHFCLILYNKSDE